ncbi:M23 family metallopeptidase [Sphingobacterium paludis]|uniref:Murein DD-endopeptidase MepM/ murein hydrolase activator NlpD n=1 Tax=Sphingobacterium paludis TaxID=1476465 RepID=A0A4R7CRF0_9SPHI|nr:M23 family metallopeptidase [Sphingobacterium paludis]TDS06598.1 murein DD-endopeptidase MepM/ murein hydrolase activator NlpD [Sphingobacterium paludis]
MLKLFPCALLAVVSFIAPVAKAYAQDTESFTTPKIDSAQQVDFERNAFSANSSDALILCSPLSLPKITSPFGMRRHPVTGRQNFHNGVDLTADKPIVMSIYDGIIVQASEHPFLGRFICTDHGGVHSIYGHLSAWLVVVGDKVRAGQEIAVMGRTGRATGVHLHFSVRIGTRYIDPIKFLLGMQEQFSNK